MNRKYNAGSKQYIFGILPVILLKQKQTRFYFLSFSDIS